MNEERIAMIGAGGVGKGTLGPMLATALKLDFIPSSVKSVGTLLYPNSQAYNKMTLNDKMTFQYCSVMSQMQNERLVGIKKHGFVAERSVFDFIPYYNRAFKNTHLSYTITSYKDLILRYAEQHPYDLLLYIPIEFEPTAEDLEKNSWKERDPKERDDTDIQIIEMLSFIKSRGTRVIRVTGDTANDRCHNILQELC